MESTDQVQTEVNQAENEGQILYGKKVILFPFSEADVEHFAKLHHQDTRGFMGKFSLFKMTPEQADHYTRLLVASKNIVVWTVMTKSANKAVRAGFVYLSSITSHSACINGIMDNKFAKGITKHINRGKYTYSEDATRTLLDACFNKFGFNRVETDVVETNRRALKLDEKIGFVKEGVLRQGLQLNDGTFKNIVFMSILKEEWNG